MEPCDVMMPGVMPRWFSALGSAITAFITKLFDVDTVRAQKLPEATTSREHLFHPHLQLLKDDAARHDRAIPKQRRHWRSR